MSASTDLCGAYGGLENASCTHRQPWKSAPAPGKQEQAGQHQETPLNGEAGFPIRKYWGDIWEIK